MGRFLTNFQYNTALTDFFFLKFGDIILLSAFLALMGLNSKLLSQLDLQYLPSRLCIFNTIQFENFELHVHVTKIFFRFCRHNFVLCFLGTLRAA